MALKNWDLFFESEIIEDIEYTVKNRVHEGRMGYELFSLRKSGKTIASCWIVYPTFAPHIRVSDNKKEGAWITRHEYFSDKKGDFVMLYCVKAVKPGKGVGQLLFQKLIEYLKTKKVNKIYLDVRHENEGAQRFYQRLGFKQKWKSFNDFRYALNVKNK